MTPLPIELERRNELHDRALAEAEALRREAMDDLWRGANAVLATASGSMLRSARRLAQRLRRRQALARGEV